MPVCKDRRPTVFKAVDDTMRKIYYDAQIKTQDQKTMKRNGWVIASERPGYSGATDVVYTRKTK